MLRNVLVIACAFAALVSAQGKGGKKGGGGDQQNIPMPTGPGNRFEQFSEILKLDKDEKKQLKTIMDDAQKEAIPVRDQMEKQRETVAQSVAAGKQDEVDTAVKAYAASESQMAEIEMSAFANFFKTLDKDQQAQSPRVFAMFMGIFKGKNWNEISAR
ncbi:MAG TPA: periplasmic heavy metal sensor [Bryobacteraceae bacterium]|jgi:Spy/CpxP family protein refolding chaperone|nr:periplasmic heavy metal sensor [Bryobacteraceae bacterium]